MVVVEGGNVLHHVNREGELSGRGNVRRGISPADMSRGSVRIHPQGHSDKLMSSIHFLLLRFTNMTSQWSYVAVNSYLVRNKKNKRRYSNRNAASKQIQENLMWL